MIQAVLSPAAGTLDDRYSPAKLATIGMTICAAGLAFAAFIGLESQISQVIQILVVMGIGSATFSTPNMTTVMESVGPAHFGIASSLVATMRTIGMLTAMTVITLLLGLFMGNAKVTADTVPGFIKTMHTGFVVFSILSLVGIAFSMVRVAAAPASSKA